MTQQRDSGDAELSLTLIIAAHQAERTLARALDSALRQRGADMAIVIVDDGSTDDTGLIAREYAAANDSVISITIPHAGTAAALNAALEIAEGSLVARLDADDELTDDYLETMSSFIAENPDYDIYAHDLFHIRPGHEPVRGFGWNEVRSFQLADLLELTHISGAGTIVRTSLLHQLGGFRESSYAEDYDLWLRALSAGARHVYVPATLYRYYRGDSSAKSADLALTYASKIDLLENLRANNTLSDRELRALDSCISYHRYLLHEVEEYGQGARSEAISASLERLLTPLTFLFGKRTAQRIVGVEFRLPRALRPVWRLWLHLAIRLRKRRTGK